MPEVLIFILGKQVTEGRRDTYTAECAKEEGWTWNYKLVGIILLPDPDGRRLRVNLRDRS